MSTGPISRRVFLALGAAVVVGACSDSSDSSDTTYSGDSGDSSNPATTNTTTTSTPVVDATTTSAPTTTLAPSPFAQAGWLAAENALEGTDAWRITIDVAPAKRGARDGSIEGFASTTSVRPGETLDFFVATGADSWHIEAYRMGHYGGRLGRLVHTSPDYPQQVQLGVSTDRPTRMTRAEWAVSASIPIDDTWPPGSYLFKLVSSTGEAHYVPVTVRRDDAVGGLMVVSAVTTWQAYNPWGGRTLYQNFGPGSRFDRALVVSFDRPYDRAYNWGSADFLTHELPLISLIEEMGLDTVYVTDIDLHTGLDLAGRTAILTTAHDEYYSRQMRTTLEQARDAGVNLAFFGANAVYRNIRLEPNAEGVPNRQMPNYRIATADPIPDDPDLTTTQWRNAPLNEPENALIGVQYFAAGIKTSMRLVDTDNWIFEGTEAVNGTTLKNLVSIEADGLGPAGREPANLQVLATSPVKYKDVVYRHAMTYYAAESGAGVFASGTIAWIHALDAAEWGDQKAADIVRGATSNILKAFSAGPSGVPYPSADTASRYRVGIAPSDD